jgi:hypothetical protein
VARAGQSFNPDEEARQEALREAFAIDLQVVIT